MTDLDDFCTGLRQEIQAAYDASENTLHWRLLTSPKHVLDGADIAFITLHPGGSVIPSDHPDLCTESGSAYVTEIWGKSREAGTARLQKQARSLFHHLRVSPEQVLAGHLIPFRSPKLTPVQSKKEAIALGESLWPRIFARAKPRLVIATGQITHAPLMNILGAKKVEEVNVGWRNYKGFRAESGNCTLIGLPCLSRFTIITHEKSCPALRLLFGSRWHD